MFKAGHLRNENLSGFWSYADRAQLLLTDSVAQTAGYTEACILPTDLPDGRPRHRPDRYGARADHQR